MTASVRAPSEARSAAVVAQDELVVLALIDHLALGGAEMLLGQFAAASPQAGVRLHVAYLEERDGSPAAAPLRDVGIEPVGLNVSGRPGVPHLRAARHLIRALSPDIVHTHLGTADFVGSIAARSLGVPSVMTIHAVPQPPCGRERVKRSFFTLSERCCVSRVIAVSDSARSAYLTQNPRMGSRVVRIYNGVDVKVAPNSGIAVRRELGIHPEDLVVGMVSALRPEKGHDIAIAVLARLLPHLPRLRLLIAGQGPSATHLARLAAPYGDRVLLVGRRTDVPSVFDACDVCLHPSRQDALPTTLIEALATSVPVLATAVGGIPEIIGDGHTGVLVQAEPSVERLAVALGELLGDPKRRRMLAENGRRSYLQRFTAEPWAQRTRALYDAVLADATTRFPNVRSLTQR